MNFQLENLAEIGNYSPFHFHIIFRGIIGETLQEYINRNRMEKSTMMFLSHQKQIFRRNFPSWFQSNSKFQQNFQKYFGVSPSVLEKYARKNLARFYQ